MGTLSISKATSFHFRLETGGSTFNSGLIRDANYLYPDTGAFYNCVGPDCGIRIDEAVFPQMYNTTDGAVEFQIEFNDSGTAPVVTVFNAKTSLSVLSITMTNITGDIWEGSVNMTTLGQGCFYIEVSSLGTPSGPNAFIQGDSGTMELNINQLKDANTGIYTIVRSIAQAETGTFSYFRDYSAGVIGLDDRLIMYNEIGTEYTLVPGTIYKIKGFVYNNSGNDYFNDLDQVFWDITDSTGFGTPGLAAKGWPDANVISRLDYLTTAINDDSWNEINSIFQPITDTVGNFRIVQALIPLTGGVHIDTVTLQVMSSVVQATSETFTVKTNHDCTTKIEYTNADNGFEIDYVTASIEHTIRVLYDGLFKFEMQDPDYQINDESDGVADVQSSFSQKIYNVTFGSLTEAMAEKLIFALKHDTCKLDGLQLLPIDDAVTPEWKEETGLCTITIRLRLRTYNFQNTNC